ncbi:H-NS family nucleoid-associated regulatory protein, partial [Xanthomonas cucurbitae]|uniref:H-NS family nucleoid-associated regulatory protein n=1 Tax=Xanthomonas cucurbitae TaxID=56453 RepID=UPI003CCC9716
MAPKYWLPHTHETWIGRGRPPRALKAWEGTPAYKQWEASHPDESSRNIRAERWQRFEEASFGRAQARKPAVSLSDGRHREAKGRGGALEVGVGWSERVLLYSGDVALKEFKVKFFSPMLIIPESADSRFYEGAAIGDCQHSCPLFHAANFISSGAFLSSLSGFSH